MSYLTISKKIEFCISFFTFYVTFPIYILKTTINQQVVLMITHEGSNKAYPSMVDHHQVILEYSMIMRQIIHSFEIDTS